MNMYTSMDDLQRRLAQRLKGKATASISIQRLHIASSKPLHMQQPAAYALVGTQCLPLTGK